MIVIIIIVLIIYVISCISSPIQGGSTSFNEIGIIKNVKLLDRKVKNLVSVSLYTLPNAYRPLSEYMKGLMTILKIVEENKFDHDIILRVYYDFTIDTELEDYKTLMKSDYAELIYVDCRKLVKQENYNSLTMFMRYLPYFSNDCNYSSVSDSDYENTSKEKIKYNMLDQYIDIIDKDYDFLFTTPIGYHPFWSKSMNLDYVCLGAFNYGKVKLNLSVFITFVKDFVNGNKFDDYKKKYIEHQNKLIRINTTDRLSKFKASKKLSQICNKKHCYFTYGFDEMFLNTIFIPEVIKHYDNVYRKIKIPRGGEFYLLKNLSKTFDIKPFLVNNNLTSDEFFNLFLEHKYKPDDELTNVYSKFRDYVIENNIPNNIYCSMIIEMLFYVNDSNNVIKMNKTGGICISNPNNFYKLTGIDNLVKERPIDTLYNITTPSKKSGFNSRI
jgi:hypothetical protein